MKQNTLVSLNIWMFFSISFFVNLMSPAVVSVKTSSALPLMVPVIPASPAGTVHIARARAHLVTMATAVGKNAPVAEITNHVT